MGETEKRKHRDKVDLFCLDYRRAFRTKLAIEMAAEGSIKEKG